MTDTPPLAGQVIVVAGTLSRLSRRELNALVERQLGRVQTSVTRDTTMLVVGEDAQALAGMAAGEDGGDSDAATPAPDAAMMTRPTAAVGRASPFAPVAAAGAASATPATSASSETSTAHAAATTADERRIAEARRLNARYPGRVRILTEREFLDLAGVPPADDATALYSARALRGLYPALRDDHLRYLERWGLVRPVRKSRQERLYRFADLSVIRQASAELAHGHAFRAVLRGLVSEREGQLALDFQPPTSGDAQPAKVIALTPRARSSSSSLASVGVPREPDPQAQAMAARYFEEGSELDCGDEAQQDAAMAAYRHAIMLDPGMVAALVNLANLHYARDAIVEAEALYEKALALDEGCFEAHFNLGNVHHDTGRFEEAVRRYEQALAIDPAYADAHFYLAVALEKLGRSAEARPHWQAYQRIAPHGEWVELAKEFSS